MFMLSQRRTLASPWQWCFWLALTLLSLSGPGFGAPSTLPSTLPPTLPPTLPSTLPPHPYSPATALTLEWQQIPTLLEQHHPALRALRLQQQAATLQARSATRLPDPQVGLSFYEAAIDLSHTPVMLEAEQAIPLHGRLKLESRMAQLAPDMQAQAHERLRRQLLAEARRAFALAREAQQSATLMQENLTRLQQLQPVLQSRFQNGSAMLMDLLKLQENIARLDNERLDMLQELEMSKVQLASLLTLTPAELPTVGALPPLPSLTWERLQRRLLQQQPMLEELKLAQQEANLEQALARTDFAPELMVRAAYMLDPGGMSMWNLGAMVQVPLHARQRQLPRQEAARLKAASISQQQEAERIALLREGRMSLLRLEKAQRHIVLHEKQLMPLSQQLVEATLAAFQSGTTSLDDVLSALSMWRMHHQEHERFMREGYEALAMLEAMTGELEGELP